MKQIEQDPWSTIDEMLSRAAAEDARGATTGDIRRLGHLLHQRLSDTEASDKQARETYDKLAKISDQLDHIRTAVVLIAVCAMALTYKGWVG